MAACWAVVMDMTWENSMAVTTADAMVGYLDADLEQ